VHWLKLLYPILPYLLISYALQLNDDDDDDDDDLEMRACDWSKSRHVMVTKSR